MNKLKILSTAIFCLAFALCKDARSMEVSEEYLDTDRSGCCSSECCKSDNSFTHWGLKHWFCGIKEYVIDRCLCCGYDPIDGDRAYIKEKSSGERILTTDCWLLQGCSIGGIGAWCEGTIMLPFATLTHLICLPVACCYPTKDGWWGTEAARVDGIVKKHKYKRDKEYRKEEERRTALNSVPTTELARLTVLVFQEDYNNHKNYGAGMSKAERESISNQIDKEILIEKKYLDSIIYK